MYIKKIIDLDGYEQSFDITVSDGVYDILCFGCYKMDKSNKFRLVCYFMDNIKKSIVKEYSIEEKNPPYYIYIINAKVLDIEKGLLKVYGFEFILEEHLPNDLNNGDYLEFECIRMDCEPV